MSKKLGPLGTPLGNPLKYFNDQKESRLPKAEGGRSIMNYEIRNNIRDNIIDNMNPHSMSYMTSDAGYDAASDAASLSPRMSSSTTPGDLPPATKRMKRKTKNRLNP